MRKTAMFHAYASRLFCLGTVSTLLVLAITGCGGASASSGGTGGGTTTKATAVAVNPSTATLAAGGTTTFAATVTGQNNPSQSVTWSVSSAAAGTVTSAGVFTASSPSAITTAQVCAASTIADFPSGCATVTINPAAPTPTSVTLACTPSAINTAQTSNCAGTVHYSDSSTSNKVTYALATGSIGSVTAAGVFSSATAGTGNVIATSTEKTSISSTPFAITVTTTVPTITGVSLVCSQTSITNAQTTSCTPTVSGTGAFTNTVNLAVSPASAGTLSASSGVSSGTAVTFTPAFATGAQTATITAISTADSTKSGGVAMMVTLRQITISSPTGNIWLPNCAGSVLYNIAQTGIVSGDTIHADPDPSSTVTTTPGSSMPVSLNIGNSPNFPNLCSPGAYDEYVTGTDGARSNDQHIPILSPWNLWAGYDSTDEYQSDFGGQVTRKFKLTDGSPDGTLPAVGLANIIDGNNLIESRLGNGGVGVYSTATGTLTYGINQSGDSIDDVAAKNGIVAYTDSTNQKIVFSPEASSSNNPYFNLLSVGTAPGAIAMSNCNPGNNIATAFSYDKEGMILYRSDATLSPANGTPGSGTVTATKVGGLALSGFSPASQLTSNLARYVVAWDSSCKAGVLAPTVNGGSYIMTFTLTDMSTGTMRQLGTVSTGIPVSAIRVVADPSGNDVVIASTDQAAGKTILTKVSWTLDSSQTPTFTVTTLGSAPPVGVYGVSLGILPSNLVPSGNVVRVGQRQQHYAFANQ